MNSKKKFSELSRTAQLSIVGAAAVQLVLLGAALKDISKRDREDINGPKAAWAAASFINFLGPLSYFAFGRKRIGN